MKAFLSAIIVSLILGIGAYLVLEKNQMTAEAKFTTKSVRN
jgi:multisubunit Na+/H+ antiporter MnhC subunit